MDFADKLFTVIVVTIIVAIVGMAIHDYLRPDLVLKKDDWQCTKTEAQTIMQLIGKVLVPVTDLVCVEYRRIGG